MSWNIMMVSSPLVETISSRARPAPMGSTLMLQPYFSLIIRVTRSAVR